jgi:hypothetical protein
MARGTSENNFSSRKFTKSDLEDNLACLKTENFELKSQMIAKDEKIRKYEVNVNHLHTQLNEVQSVSLSDYPDRCRS